MVGAARELLDSCHETTDILQIMSNQWTSTRIKASKGKQKLACLTAYDYLTAKTIDKAGIELVLVGDSLAMTALGYKTTLPVTMEEMIHHTSAVSRGVQHAMVVADMPFMSYQTSTQTALFNAGRFLKEANAKAVKIEGGAHRSELVSTMVKNGIPVLGHIGLTPQSINALGGYKVQGKAPEDAASLKKDASALCEAGVFALVLECVPADVAREITESVPAPTIGIGAGVHCDGQILVSQDMLGMYSEMTPKFVKRYASINEEMNTAFEKYREEVQNGDFPAEEHSY
jgi:3-methyl-2-oxobutanoate hydroxymethyltransferase